MEARPDEVATSRPEEPRIATPSKVECRGDVTGIELVAALPDSPRYSLTWIWPTGISKESRPIARLPRGRFYVELLASGGGRVVRDRKLIEVADTLPPIWKGPECYAVPPKAAPSAISQILRELVEDQCESELFIRTRIFHGVAEVFAADRSGNELHQRVKLVRGYDDCSELPSN